MVIATGGTGGHIYPAITVAKTIKNKFSDSKIYFVGRAVDKDIIVKAGFDFLTIRIFKVPEKFLGKITYFPFEMLLSIKEAILILKDLNPDFVLGFGSFASFPTMIGAIFLNLYTAIHEQNAVPGLANKILAKFVKRVFVNFNSSLSHFPPKKTVLSGFPIRFENDDLSIPKGLAKEKLGLDNMKKTILFFGGSQGAKIINDVAVKLILLFENRSDVQFILLTGNKNYENVKNKLISIKAKCDNIKILPYLEEIKYAYLSSDIAVCRSGASSLSELHFFSLPALLVPLGIAKGQHQLKNAEIYAQLGAVKIIEEKFFSEKTLYNELIPLLEDNGKLEKMRNAYKNLNFVDAKKVIMEEIKKIGSTTKKNCK